MIKMRLIMILISNSFIWSSDSHDVLLTVIFVPVSFVFQYRAVSLEVGQSASRPVGQSASRPVGQLTVGQPASRPVGQ